MQSCDRRKPPFAKEDTVVIYGWQIYGWLLITTCVDSCQYTTGCAPRIKCSEDTTLTILVFPHYNPIFLLKSYATALHNAIGLLPAIVSVHEKLATTWVGYANRAS